jgi:putative restriction endonuclease
MAEVIERFRGLNVWARGAERAPHKPLLLLLALGALSRGERVLPFKEVEVKLTELLREFGPTRKSMHPEYPFWRLQNDGLWVVKSDSTLHARKGNTDPTRSSLRAADAKGELAAEVVKALLAKPRRITEAAQLLLEENFPETLHRDIQNAVGLVVDVTTETRRARDPNFRNAVLVAYQYRCAMCGLDLRVGTITVGIEAAHIMWHQARGPDQVNNGYALCALHHKLFDYGAFTVAESGQILVSEHVNGSAMVDQVLMRHHGQQLAAPRRDEHVARPEFLQWHKAWVFKREALPPGALE